MGLYLKDKKVSPAIYTTSNSFKIHPPYLRMDWDNDKLYVFNRVVNPPFSARAISNVNGIEKTHTMMDGYTLEGSGVSSYKNVKLSDSNEYGYGLHPKNLTIGQLGISETGKYDIKLKYTNIEPRKYAEDTINLSSESDYSDILHYERWNYTNNITDLGLDAGNTSGILNYTKYDEDKLINYNKSITYNYNLDPSNQGILDTNNSYNIVITSKSDDSLVCNGYYYCSSFAKISFTLDADTKVKVKYQITKSSSTTPTILICPIDKNYTSFYYYDKLSNPVVSFNTTTDFEEKEYSFGTLSAGEHFYFVQFYNNNGDFRNTWSANITPVYEKISTGKYLPPDITVENSEDINPYYEYDPYTGKFKISMTGNITMTAIGADKPALSKLLITTATWNVSTSTLTWNYSIDGATYYIQTPDGQEYTTTEKSFDFTGKLGEPSGDYKSIKIWAKTSDNQSGKTILKLICNPKGIFFNKSEILPSGFSFNSYMYPFFYTFYKNDFLLFIRNDNSLTNYILKYNFETKAFDTIHNFKATGTRKTKYSFLIDNNLYSIYTDGKCHKFNLDTYELENITLIDDNLKNSPSKIILYNNKIYYLSNNVLYYKDNIDSAQIKLLSSNTLIEVGNKLYTTNSNGGVLNLINNKNELIEMKYSDDTYIKNVRNIIELDNYMILIKVSNNRYFAEYINKTNMELIKTIQLPLTSYSYALFKTAINNKVFFKSLNTASDEGYLLSFDDLEVSSSEKLNFNLSIIQNNMYFNSFIPYIDSKYLIYFNNYTSELTWIW